MEDNVKYEINYNKSLIKEHNGWENFQENEDVMEGQTEFD